LLPLFISKETRPGQKAQRVALLPGVDWSEQQCGTNAIGTVLIERQPLAVLGGEHFLSGHGGLGCAAAPIFTGRGEIAGVLDISGDAIRIDGHTLGMVRMASQQIGHWMILHGVAEDPSLAKTFRQAVKVLDAGVAVLVTGETGVGKEVFTRRLHAASQRHAGPLVIVNCAALP